MNRDGIPSTDTNTPRISDTQRYGRIGWLIVIVGFLGFVAWAALAPLDRGVVVEGTVTVSGYRKAVQHPTGGVIQDIFVQEGELVQQGQLLVQMDSAVPGAKAQAARNHYFMALATEARLLAEKDGLPGIQFPPPLLQHTSADPALIANIEIAKTLQQQLFASRRQALQAEINSLEENLASSRARLIGLQGLSESQRQRSRLMARRIEGLQELAAEDFIPRNRVLEILEIHEQLRGNQLSTEADIDSTGRQIAELQARIVHRRANYQQELRAQLADIRLQIENQRERMTAAELELSQTRVVAPVTGRVVDLKVFTQGGVIGPAELLMEILPENQPLQVDARLPLDMVDSMTLQQPVDLLFTAFNRSQTPKVAGRVVQWSADRLIDEDTRQGYYGLKIEVTANAMAELNGLKILPGMPVQAFIRNGERSLLSYLFKPLTDRIPIAMAGEE